MGFGHKDTSTMLQGRNQGNPNNNACKYCGDTSSRVEYCSTHGAYLCDKKPCHEQHLRDCESIRKKYGSPFTSCYWHKA